MGQQYSTILGKCSHPSDSSLPIESVQIEVYVDSWETHYGWDSRDLEEGEEAKYTLISTFSATGGGSASLDRVPYDWTKSIDLTAGHFQVVQETCCCRCKFSMPVGPGGFAVAYDLSTRYSPTEFGQYLGTEEETGTVSRYALWGPWFWGDARCNRGKPDRVFTDPPRFMPGVRGDFYCESAQPFLEYEEIPGIPPPVTVRDIYGAYDKRIEGYPDDPDTGSLAGDGKSFWVPIWDPCDQRDFTVSATFSFALPESDPESEHAGEIVTRGGTTIYFHVAYSAAEGTATDETGGSGLGDSGGLGDFGGLGDNGGLTTGGLTTGGLTTGNLGDSGGLGSSGGLGNPSLGSNGGLGSSGGLGSGGGLTTGGLGSASGGLGDDGGL